MKNKLNLTISLSIVLISVSSFVFISNTGIAAHTGSPGEATCSHCHGGGSSSASAITISSTPSFTNNEYVPGTTYTMEITVSATGFGKFGFGCEILGATNNANAGLMQTAGPGVKFINAVVQGVGRRNAVHTTGKLNSGSATFTFEWVASQTGPVTIYVAGNAVNNDGNTTGDFPLTPISLALQAAQPIDPVGLNEINPLHGEVIVYPVPSKGVSSISYNLKESAQIKIQICDLTGKELKTYASEEQQQGAHTKLLNLEEFAPGVYFVKLSVNDKKLSQKLLVIN